MRQRPETLRYILGLKLRRFRQKRRLALKEVAAKTGLSISYLSEIETGRKYPKPEKILALSEALAVPFDDLVSLKVDDELGPLADLFDSPFLREFPFHLYGLDMENLLSLLTEAPSKASAMLRTALEIGRTYDVRVEHFLFAALRSFQHQHHNYFEDIERAADAFVEEHGWREAKGLPALQLKRILEEEHGYQVRYELFARDHALRGLRSVHLDGRRPRVLLNERLLPSQKAFQLARELGFVRLGLKERSHTSSPLKVESFDQVTNDFKAAYFAGAVILRRDLLVADIEAFFKRKTWSAADFLAFLHDYGTTPETFFYRLSQLIPQSFGLKEIFFLRLSHGGDEDRFRLSKILNMSQLSIFHGLEPHAHYCRRWAGGGLRRALAAYRAGGEPPAGGANAVAGDWVATAQRAAFVAADAEYFVITLARPLVLAEDAGTSVSLGFLMDRRFKRRVRFWNDPQVPQVEVNLTCERCGLAADECAQRAAPPVLYRAEEQRRLREQQLARLIAESEERKDRGPR